MGHYDECYEAEAERNARRTPFMPKTKKSIRDFDTGACRDTDNGKLDYEGFLSPLVIEAYAKYLHHHRRMKDGTLRASDNWQKGIPRTEYMKSGYRHFIDWWKVHRGYKVRDGIVAACCGVLFNVSGYLHEYLKANPDVNHGPHQAPDGVDKTKWEEGT